MSNKKILIQLNSKPKMKQLCILFGLLFFSSTFYAQDTEGINGINHMRSYLRKSQQLESGLKSLTYLDIEGNPFSSKDFGSGQVFTKEGVFKEVKMKYDIYMDAFLFDLNGTELYLEASDYVKKVVLDNQVFIISTLPNVKKKAGFIIQLDSNKVSLFAKKNIYFRSAEPAKAIEARPTPAAFVPRANKYYIKVGSSPLVQIEKLKDIYELFPAEEEALKKFIKTEDLNFKNESDLVKIIQQVNKSI